MVEDMNIFDSFIDVLHKRAGARDSTTRRRRSPTSHMRKMADRWSAEDDDGW